MGQILLAESRTERYRSVGAALQILRHIEHIVFHTFRLLFDVAHTFRRIGHGSLHKLVYRVVYPVAVVGFDVGIAGRQHQVSAGVCSIGIVVFNIRYHLAGGFVVPLIIAFGTAQIDIFYAHRLEIDTRNRRDDVGCAITLACGACLHRRQHLRTLVHANVVYQKVIAVRCAAVVRYAQAVLLVVAVGFDGEEHLLPPLVGQNLAGREGGLLVFVAFGIDAYQLELKHRRSTATLGVGRIDPRRTEHARAGAQFRFQVEAHHLTGHSGAVAIEHVAVFGTAAVVGSL